MKIMAEIPEGHMGDTGAVEPGRKGMLGVAQPPPAVKIKTTAGGRRATADEQMQMQAAGLLRELPAALDGEEWQDLSWLTLADLVAMLRAVSVWRKEQGLTTAPATILVPSLTDALLHYQRDELTGLYNRRGFFTLAEQQLKLACRSAR